MRCTHSNIGVVLFWNSVVNTTEPLISSCVLIWKPKQSTFALTTKHTASSGHDGGSNNTTARLKVPPSFIAYTFGRCFANLPTQWCRRGGVFEWAALEARGQILTFIKNISLVSLCNFRDLIYAQTAYNTPKRTENLKSHHIIPLKRTMHCISELVCEEKNRRIKTTAGL